MKFIRLIKAISCAVVVPLASGCTETTADAVSNTNTAQTGSLTGKRGNVRRNLPRGHGECGRAVDRYIAASGHSAYASTSFSYFDEKGVICSTGLNYKSVQQAEATALRGCKAGIIKWKHHHSGECEIHASK
ncbi:MAG: hypothetical protein GY789_22225 [Hyphomicrobiales bacterium]|nr:hypothetical protein [Hyphomicrobiales bacterium]